MRLGLLADIHEDVERLAAAVGELVTRRVDSFVTLGDISHEGRRIAETVALLAPLPGAGVWGNHDLGLCGEVEPSLRDRFPDAVIAYFARLQPALELGGCRFQHIDPHLDPHRFEDMWSFTSEEERARGFANCPYPRAFMGHLHGWAIYTPEGAVPWDGARRYRFEADRRYLSVVHAVAEGWCAVMDTDLDELEPVRVR